MKTNKITLAVLLLMSIIGATPLIAQTEVKEQLVVPLTDPNKTGTLKVSLINGAITIVGYSGKEIVIDATTVASPSKKSEPKSDELTSGMKRISSSNGGFDITAEERNNTVKVSSPMARRPVNLTIKVPQQFSLNVSTINNGDIAIENVSGELEITNVNGAILMANVSGSAVANTVNGNLKATFRSINAEAPMAFSTLNGNVDVTFPTTAKFDVKLKSEHGEIYSDFDVDVDKSQPKSTRVIKDGMYKVTVDDWVQGKVNGGGRELMMKNMHGNIYIRKAK